MSILKDIFAIIGVFLSILMCVIFFKYMHITKSLDEKAVSVYAKMFADLLESKSLVKATVWKSAVADEVEVEDVIAAVRNAANDLNIKNVGELPLSDEVQSLQGKPYRTVRIFMLCNALTAKNMLDFDDAYAAYLPCRISLVEDKKGKLWLYSLNMDMMIYGGAPLPAQLKQEALKVKTLILDIMERGSNGDF